MPGIAQFTRALSEESEVSQSDCRRVCDAIFRLVVRELREQGSSSIPNLARVKRQTLKASPGGTKKVFGKTIQAEAKPERHRLRVCVPKKLKDAVCAKGPAS